jgi:non-hemolytic enterotoxin B/C
MTTLTAVKAAIAANDDVTTNMAKGLQNQSSQALILQGYALSVLQQPKISLGTAPNLAKLESDLNAGLDKACGHAKTFRNEILPSMVKTVTDIRDYFSLQNALGQALRPDDKKTTIAELQAVLDRTNQYKSNSVFLQTQLTKLSTDISGDSAVFADFVTKLNVAVNGDNNLLSQIDSALREIDGKIAGSITGVVVSGLSIAGGVFLILVGSIANFVTAGTSTPLVIAGIGILVAGAAGEVASAVTLANLLGEKGELLRMQSQLREEVNLAVGLKSGYNLLATSASQAATAAQQMANAWGLLSGHIDNLIKNVQSGKQSIEDLQNMYLNAARGAVADALRDVTTIEGQLAGVKQVIAPSNTTIAKHIVEVARANQRAA